MRFFWIICLGLWLGLALRSMAQPNVTRFARMTSQIQDDARRCSLIRITSLGQSAAGHRPLWMVRLADSASDSAASIRVMVLCRQHGDEPASTEAVLSLIHRLAGGSDPLLRASLAHVTLYIVPMVNPDGAEANTRGNGVGADLNRDWGVFQQPETRAVARAAHLLHPSLVIDAHNWDGSDEYNADCLEIARENATPLGRMSHIFQQQSARDLAGSGYAIHPTAWGPDTDPRLAHRWFARQNILSALVETHYGDPSDHADFQRRQGMYVALLHSLLRRCSMDIASEKPKLDRLEGDAAVVVQETIFFPPIPKTNSVRGLKLASHFFPVWLWACGILGVALWSMGLNAGSRSDPKPLGSMGQGRTSIKIGYYSFARKREGTETRVRSGQRKAVSKPPR